MHMNIEWNTHSQGCFPEWYPEQWPSLRSSDSWIEFTGLSTCLTDPNTLHPPTTILGHTRQSDCLRLLEVSLGNPPPLF